MVETRAELPLYRGSDRLLKPRPGRPQRTCTKTWRAVVLVPRGLVGRNGEQLPLPPEAAGTIGNVLLIERFASTPPR